MQTGYVSYDLLKSSFTCISLTTVHCALFYISCLSLEVKIYLGFLFICKCCCFYKWVKLNTCNQLWENIFLSRNCKMFRNARQKVLRCQYFNEVIVIQSKYTVFLCKLDSFRHGNHEEFNACTSNSSIMASIMTLLILLKE